MESTASAAKRLWTLCNVLRDDGITYHQYISELTLILFFKLAAQLGLEDSIPLEYRWANLKTLSGDALLDTFRESIGALAESRNQPVRGMFQDNKTTIRSGVSLERLLRGIDTIEWNNFEPSDIGEIYESLIGRNAQESRYGAGQYFTPRALVAAMVQVTKPDRRDSVYDPAAGTAGFLVAAGLHARRNSGQQCDLIGNELVPEVLRMAQMNLHLHGLDADMRQVDTLSRDPHLERHTLCLSNPPFGMRSDLNPTQRDKLAFLTNNKQLNFLQHIYTSLNVGARAAAVVPDNVLFESGVAESIRQYLLDNFNLHTLLRLPTGIFYATGVKTSVLFFAKTGSTDATWVYDLRFGNNGFTRRRPLVEDDLSDFVERFGPNKDGSSSRSESACFQRFSRASMKALDDRLDLIGTPRSETRHGPASVTLEMIARELEQAASATRELQAMLDRVGKVE